jgi:hypothetical protein
MEVLVIIGLVMAAAIIIASATKAAQTRAAEQRRDVLSQHYAMDEVYVSTVDSSAVGINFEAERILLGQRGRETEYSFDQIAAVEVQENGATVSTTNRGSQLAGAAIGGLALGGVGALIGGLSGSRTSHQKVSSIVLNVSVDSTIEPIHKITFLQVSGAGVEADGLVAQPARDAAERVHAHLINAMRRVQERTSSTRALPAAPNLDQLGKLWELRQAGALTEGEYASQKAALLSPPAPALAAPKAVTAGRRYELLLVHPGDRRRSFVKALQTHLPKVLTSKAAQNMYQNLPYPLLRNADERRAFAVRDALTEPEWS